VLNVFVSYACVCVCVCVCVCAPVYTCMRVILIICGESVCTCVCIRLLKFMHMVCSGIDSDTCDYLIIVILQLVLSGHPWCTESSKGQPLDKFRVLDLVSVASINSKV
jgi:hypothetical protein